ncbi:MAG: prepilin-type N-terminal cleavage/methylation domain-containing protein [Thermodesulfovibrionales bacterium]|nr:prepilin-type N-terminal cleavage/methylation domain-containing protein [Thermodesulfovibrionales bacterium]
MKSKGLTLMELLIVLAILSILAMIGIPAYIGQQKRAARTEAFTNLETLRLLEEQYFADNGVYTGNLGTCAKDRNNIPAIQAVLPGFKPGSNLNFSYCIEANIDINGNTQTPCFRARAFGNTGTRVDGDEFRIDCNNNRNF